MKSEKLDYAPGLYSDLTNVQYHGSNGVSSSRLKRLLENTPAKTRYEDAHAERKPNAVYDLGSAVHALVLEPQNFQRDFAVSDVWNLHTNAGKAAKAAFIEANQGKTIINIEQQERAMSMAHAVIDNAVASMLLGDVMVEQSIFWQYTNLFEYSDFSPLLKVRPDAVSPHHTLIVDIKTCQSASWSDMQAAILKYKYHLSAAMYLEGANQCRPLKDALGIDRFTGFVLICVESEPPYQVACYELSALYLDKGLQQYRAALERYRMAVEDNWPAYPNSLRVIEPPPWADRIAFV